MRKLLVLCSDKDLGQKYGRLQTNRAVAFSTGVSKLSEAVNFSLNQPFPPSPIAAIVTPSPLYTPLPQATNDDLLLPSLFLFSISLALGVGEETAAVYVEILRRTFEKRCQPALLACYSWKRGRGRWESKNIIPSSYVHKFRCCRGHREEKARGTGGGEEKIVASSRKQRSRRARVSVALERCLHDDTKLASLPSQPKDLLG